MAGIGPPGWGGFRSSKEEFDPPGTPTSDDPEQPRDHDLEKVLAWRELYLLRAGLDPEAAHLIAERVGVDLHRAAEMVESGCSADLALRILL